MEALRCPMNDFISGIKERNPPQIVPIEHFIAEICKATLWSEATLKTKDPTEIEQRLGIRHPCPAEDCLYAWRGPYQRARHRQVIDKMLAQDLARDAKAPNLPDRILRS